MLWLVWAAWAQTDPAGPAACPLLPSPRDAEVALIGDRVRLRLDPQGAQRVSGLDLTADDPDVLVPDHFWRELVRWTPGDDVVLVGASDPLELAVPDLAPRALRGLAARMGPQPEPWSTRPLAVSPPLGPAVLAEPAPDPAALTWGVVAEVALPDGTIVELVGALFGALAQDAACREAVVARLMTAVPGRMTRADYGDKHFELPVITGGGMAVEVPADMALRVDVGMQRTRFVVQDWGRADSDATPDQLVITVSHVPWSRPDGRRGKAKDVTPALGDFAAWRRVKGDRHLREAWVEVPGAGGGWELLHLELRSTSDVSAARLREVAALARRLSG